VSIILINFSLSPKVQPEEEETYTQFWKLNKYIAGSYDNANDFKALKKALNQNANGTASNRLFYLALPPTVFESVTVLIKNVCTGLK